MTNKNDHINVFDGYTPVLYPDDDGDWIAHLLEMPNVSAFGDTPDGAIKELRIAWSGVKESYRKHEEALPPALPHEPLYGNLDIRIDPKMHRALVIEADNAGLSLNELVSRKLEKSVVMQD